MARIALADIPNAPMPVPLPKGDNLQQVNFSGAENMLRRPEIAQGSFDGKARGMQAIAQGVTDLGRGVSDYGHAMAQIALHKAQADTDVQIMSASNAMTMAHSEYAAELVANPGRDTNQDVPQWHERLGQVAKDALADKTLSPEARHQITQRLNDYKAQTTGPLIINAAKTSDARSTALHEEDLKQRIAAGDLVGAERTIDTMRAKNLLFEGQVEGLKQNARSSVAFQKLMIRANDDPKGLRADLGDNTKDGEFVDVNPIQFQKIKDETNRNYNAQHNDTFQTVWALAEAGQVATADDALKLMNGFDTQEDKARFTRLYQQGKIPLTFGALHAASVAVADYNPTEDQEAGFEGVKAFDISTNIKLTIPEGPERTKVLKELEDKGSNKPSADVLSGATKQINSLLETQQLGRWDVDKLKKPLPTGKEINFIGPTDLQEWNAEFGKKTRAEQRAVELKRDIETWIKRNPNASPADVNAELYKRAGITSDAANVQKLTPEELPVARSQREIEARKALAPKTSATTALPEALISSVKDIEGFTAKAEWDYKQNSVGYGTRAKQAGETLTEAQADQRLREELTMHAARVDEAAKSYGFKLSEGQRNALISFDFNTGQAEDVIGSSASIDEIKRRLPLYHKVTEGGKKVASKGLIARRAKELAMFNS